MNERVRGRRSAGEPDWQRMTKPERRAAAKAERARAAAAKRRRQTLLGVLAGVAVVGVIVAAFVLFGGSDKPADKSGTAPQSSASAGPTAGPTSAAFPPLPAGADPALGKKPTATAGTGAVTKLVAKPLITGTGPAAQAGQSITVNYVGVSYPTGKEFDASWNQSQPFTFQLGGGNVIKGWDQGLVGATVGSRIQLDIPADLAYGDNPTGGQPGGPLRFIVDVLAVQ